MEEEQEGGVKGVGGGGRCSEARVGWAVCRRTAEGSGGGPGRERRRLARNGRRLARNDST